MSEHENWCNNFKEILRKIEWVIFIRLYTRKLNWNKETDPG